MGVNVAFYDGYRIYDRLEDPGAIPLMVLQQGASRVHAQAYVDLFAARRIVLDGAVGGLRELQVRFGVQNILDHSPPVIAQPGGLGSTTFNYSTYGDPRRRRFEINLIGHF